MITNREILRNQLKRINEKCNSNLQLGKIRNLWYLYCVGEGGHEIQPYPIGDFTRRTAQQMIEFLAGMENAIDYFTGQKE